ncbi:MAG: TIGR03809 family protein, partial [Bradyrhizobium sp.]|nr:TIGR03809 family protein [Bradyrhizobium sp.]
HSEHAFLENIQEAKTAVETWRSLSTREASPDNSAIDMSWLGHSRTASPDEGLCDEPDPLASPPTEIVAELWPPGVSDGVEPMHVASDEAPSAPALDTPRLDDATDLTLDAIAQRYPLLRNAL